MANLLEEASILLTPTAYNDGSMLSVKPENGDGDFTFSRNSAATRVNAQGLVENVQIISSNLVSNGDFATDSVWVKDGNWSIANGKATSTGVGRMFQSIPFLETNVGTKVVVSFDIVDYISGGVVIQCYGASSENFTGVGTHTFTTTTTNTLNLYINNSGLGNLVGSIDNISVKEITDETNLPRINYEDGCGSWLLEPQSTNLYLNSETLSTQNNTTSATTYSVSFYGTGTITFSGAYSGTLVGDGLSNRVSATFFAASGTLVSTVSGTCTKAQLEQKSFATSYIPTLGASSTRLQDIATNSGNASLINSEEGVLYAETKASVNSGNITLSNGSNNDNLIISFNLSSGRIDCNMKAGGVYQFIFNYTTDMTINNKIAVRYKANDFSLFVNGIKVLTDTSGITPIANTFDRLNFSSANTAANYFYGKTKALAVYKTALTDEQLTALTTI